MKNPVVLVLMSTYNGELFLKEQIDSILSQEGVDVRLLVRDDGSKDNTCSILSDYASAHQNIEWKACENVGFVKSFSVLVKMAMASEIPANYYAFADQDDIWMPKKLVTACSVLSSKDPCKPNLFTSNSMQVDAEGKELELFHKGPEPKFRKGNVLVFGTEQGCSMVFNRRAIELYSECEPQLTWHDRWLYHICYFLGSVTYDHRPLFYYRRHENNALANHHAGSLEGEPNKIVRVYRILFVEPPVTNHVEMAKEFYDHFASRLNTADRQLFKRFIACRKSIVSKIYMLFSRHFIYPYYDANEGRLLKWLIMAGRL
ncbi:MAG: glycosyltransferase [Prevotella sp.]|nr:glycosyltransferase [Prevotella sp.]